MASYLFVDVDTLLTRLRQRGVSIDLYEFANKMRGGAALAAGLNNPSDLVAVAVAPWEMEEAVYGGSVSPQRAFTASGFELCDLPDRAQFGAVLIDQYLQADQSVNELILATNDASILPFLTQVKLAPGGRLRKGRP